MEANKLDTLEGNDRCMRLMKQLGDSAGWKEIIRYIDDIHIPVLLKKLGDPSIDRSGGEDQVVRGMLMELDVIKNMPKTLANANEVFIKSKQDEIERRNIEDAKRTG